MLAKARSRARPGTAGAASRVGLGERGSKSILARTTTNVRGGRGGRRAGPARTVAKPNRCPGRPDRGLLRRSCSLTARESGSTPRSQVGHGDYRHGSCCSEGPCATSARCQPQRLPAGAPRGDLRHGSDRLPAGPGHLVQPDRHHRRARGPLHRAQELRRRPARPDVQPGPAQHADHRGRRDRGQDHAERRAGVPDARRVPRPRHPAHAVRPALDRSRSR